MKKIFLVFIGLVFTSLSAFATLSGKELYEDCTAKKETESRGRDFCVGYIAGFLDTYVLTSALHKVNPENRHFCLGSEGISYRQAIQIAVDYFDRNQSKLNESARNLLVMAFAERYPCKKMNYHYQEPKSQKNEEQQYEEI